MFHSPTVLLILGDLKLNHFLPTRMFALNLQRRLITITQSLLFVHSQAELKHADYFSNLVHGHDYKSTVTKLADYDA